MKKILAIYLCIGMLIFAACTPGSDSSGSGDKTSASDSGGGGPVYNLSDFTESVEYVGFLTGDRSPNNQSAVVGGTDLGFPIYDEENDRMYFAFGDTFAGDMNTAALWRSNVMGYKDDFSKTDISKGITFTDWLQGSNTNGAASYMIQGHHATSEEKFEVTKIPTGGIVIDGAIYVFYMSVRAWGAGGWWDCNYSGVIRSTDNGATWQRVFDLTWAETDSGKYAEQIKKLAGQNTDLTDGNYDLDLSERVAPGFMQITPVDGKDGYIYLFGIEGGRQNGQQMARVRKESFEQFDEYEYFIGYSNKVPQWQKGTSGLKKILNNKSAYVISVRMGEATCYYNEYMGYWIMTDNIDNVIYMSMSKNVYGPYSPKYAILDTSYPFAEHGLSGDFSSLYAGFSHAMLTANGGKTMYFIVSYYDPIYNSVIMKAEFC